MCKHMKNLPIQIQGGVGFSEFRGRGFDKGEGKFRGVETSFGAMGKFDKEVNFDRKVNFDSKINVVGHYAKHLHLSVIFLGMFQ